MQEIPVDSDAHVLAAAAQRVLDDDEVWIASGTGGRLPVPGPLRALIASWWRAAARREDLVVIAERPEVSPAKAAELLGVTRQYVDRLIARGDLPATRLPKSRYRKVPLDAVLALRDGRAAAAPVRPSRGEPPQTPAVAPPAATAHGQQRRERLVAAAAHLFGERGYQPVGVAEIGAAAGVSGPALYRHFPNKTQLLVAVFDEVIDGFLAMSEGVLERVAGDPQERLYALTRGHVATLLRNPGVFTVYGQEWRNLADEDQIRLRQKQRAYIARWVGVIVAVYPALTEREAWGRAQVVLGLVNSVGGYRDAMEHDDLADLLTAGAVAGLTVPREHLGRGRVSNLPPM